MNYGALPLGSMGYVAIDFETTGFVESHPEEPWQVGWVRIEQAQIVPSSCYTSFIRIGERPVRTAAPAAFAAVRDAVRAAPERIELWPLLRTELSGIPLIAHNCPTEKRVLSEWAPMHRFGPWIDTLRIARAVYPDLASHALSDVLHRLRLMDDVHHIVPGRSAHDALFDAVGCAVLWSHFLSLPGWLSMPLEQLLILQHKNKGSSR